MKNSREGSFLCAFLSFFGIITMFFPFYIINLSSSESLMFGIKFNENTFSMASLIRGIGEVADLFGGTAGKMAMNRFAVFIVLFLPYILLLIAFALFFINKKATNMANLIIISFDFVYLLLMHLLIIPIQIGKMATSSLLGIDGVDLLVQKSYRSSLFLGYYILLFFLFVLIICSIGVISENKKEEIQAQTMHPELVNQAPGQFENSPMVSVIGGSLSGARFQIQPGEKIIIGRDPAQCHIVINDTNASVSRRHCMISFDDIHGMFCVEDCSTNGTFQDDRNRLKRNEPSFLPRGTMISIGNKSNKFLLE